MSAASVTTTPEPPVLEKLDRYKKQLSKLPSSAVDVLLAGDSLASMWQKPSLRATFEDCRIAKMSMTGDKIQNTLWKVRSGDFDHLRPRIVLLIVGTNNLPKGTPLAIAQGVVTVVQEMMDRWSPESLFVVGIPPRGLKGTFKAARRKQANERIREAFLSHPRVRYVDVDKALAGDTAAYHPDMVHLSDHGYDLLSLVVKSAYLEFRNAAVAADLQEIRRRRQEEAVERAHKLVHSTPALKHPASMPSPANDVVARGPALPPPSLIERVLRFFGR